MRLPRLCLGFCLIGPTVLGTACAAPTATPLPAAPAAAPAAAPIDFHPFVLRAVEKLAQERSGGLYDIRKAFTRDLDYGSGCCVPASKPKVREPGPNPTMCVAAVSEVMIEALNLYAHDTGDRAFMQQLPMSSWTRGNVTSIRAHLFMYQGTGSRGTAYTLQKFGMGRIVPFPQLQPGDFVNLNRAHSGHAVVFLGFLDGNDGTTSPAWSDATRGFRYFSAQGQNRPDGGFGYRNAWFDGACPTQRGKNDDCGIVGKPRRKADGSVLQNQILLNTGEMFAPPQWHVAQALANLETAVSRGVEEDSGLTRGNGLEEAVQAELERELLPDLAKYQDGSE